MIMDLRTIYLMDAALYLMLHAAIWVGLLSYRSRLVAAWSLSGIVSAAGLVFLGMRGVWPDWTLVICGQFLMAAGNFGRQITLRSMLGSIPRLWWWGHGLFNLAYLGAGLVLFLQDAGQWERLVLLFYAFYTLNLIEYVLIGQAMRKKMAVSGAWAIEMAGVAFCVSLGIKTLALLTGWGEVDLYTMAWDQMVVFVGQFVAISLINVGFMQAFVGQIQEERARADKQMLLEQQKSQMLEQHARTTEGLLKEREEIIRQLTLSNKSAGMGALVAGIAHEVNQPLTALMIKTEVIEAMLERMPESTGVHGLGAEIRDDVVRVSNIVRTLRSMFMLGRGKYECIELTALVRDVLLIVEGRRQRQAIQLHAQLDEPVRVLGDVTQLQQVVLNMINNAMDAVSDPSVSAPCITVRCVTEREDVHLTVTDNGVGIDRERQAEIFAMFKTSKAQGMGVGLWLSRSIVESHGGRLGFESDPSHQTTFHLYLPEFKDIQI